MPDFGEAAGCSSPANASALTASARYFCSTGCGGCGGAGHSARNSSKPCAKPNPLARRPLARNAPHAYPWSLRTSATLISESASRESNLTTPCCDGNREVSTEATDGFVHELCAYAWWKTYAPPASESRNGVSPRVPP